MPRMIHTTKPDKLAGSFGTRPLFCCFIKEIIYANLAKTGIQYCPLTRKTSRYTALDKRRIQRVFVYGSAFHRTGHVRQDSISAARDGLLRISWCAFAYVKIIRHMQFPLGQGLAFQIVFHNAMVVCIGYQYGITHH